MPTLQRLKEGISRKHADRIDHDWPCCWYILASESCKWRYKHCKNNVINAGKHIRRQDLRINLGIRDFSNDTVATVRDVSWRTSRSTTKSRGSTTMSAVNTELDGGDAAISANSGTGSKTKEFICCWTMTVWNLSREIRRCRSSRVVAGQVLS